MRPPNAVGGPLAVPLLCMIAFFAVTEANEHFGTEVISAKNISGWITCCESANYITIQETRPTRAIINPRFGPTNIPAASTIHKFRNPGLDFGIKVGDHVSVRATCIGKQALPINTNTICIIQEATLLPN